MLILWCVIFGQREWITFALLCVKFVSIVTATLSPDHFN